MNTPSLILATLLLAVVPAARADPPDVQLRKAQQDLFEAFTSGRAPNPELLDVPVLRDPNRFPAETRYNAERLQRLVRQVAGIQDGTDGSENGKGRQMLHIQEVAYQFQRLLRVPDGMPPKPVVALYQTKINGSATSAAQPLGSVPPPPPAAAIPDPNKARMGTLMNADVFGPARDPGVGLAATERYLTDAPMRAAEFRPPTKPLAIVAVPSPWDAPPDLTKTPYFDVMARYHADYVANVKQVSGLMDEYRQRRLSDCEHAASPACTSNTFALGVGYARLFVNATGAKLTGASTVGGQAKELGQFALDLSPAGGIVQAYEDYEQSGLGHFGDWKNLGLAVAGLAPFARTGKQVYTGAKAVREGEAVLVEAGKVGKTVVSDALGAGLSPAKAADLRQAGHFWSKVEVERFGKPALDRASARVEEIKKIHERKGLPSLSLEEEKRLLQVRLYRELNPIQGTPERKLGEGGLTNVDTFNDPRIRTRDHHGPYFNPKTPEVDSTMLVLDDIEELAAANGTIGKQDLTRLAQKMERIHTDNMGDGLWGLWIARNLERVAEDPALRESIRMATKYEDFGLFGKKAGELARKDPKLAEAMELQNSILYGYDDILKRFKLADDRFGHLPAARQRQLVAEGLGVLDRALADSAQRAQAAKSFSESVSRASAIARRAQLKFPAATAKALARELGSPSAVREASSKFLDRIFVLDSGELKDFGVFAGWAGQSQAHEKNLQLAFKALPADKLGHPRTSMVFSVPDGKSAESIELFGAWLSQANAAKAARLGVLAGEAGAILGREALQVAFTPGLLLNADEIMAEAVRFAHHLPKVEKSVRRASGASGLIIGARTIPEGSSATKPAILEAVRNTFTAVTP